jgi:C-terminal processing protease CtpA/Prc
MMAFRHGVTILALTALLSGCGGGGGGSGPTGGTAGTTGGTTPTPTPTQTARCSLRARQDWAAAQLREWYLFPETLPASLDPSPFATVDDYVDALTANARAQRRDRYFTYLTSISGEDAYYATGASGGFGIRLMLRDNRLYVSEVFEDTPAAAAGIERGTEIVAIGATAGGLRTVTDLLAAGGDALDTALGGETAGLVRVLRVADRDRTIRDLTIIKADYAIAPVSPRYGAKILDDGGRRVGYLNLRTFITSADPALRAAFARFRAEGVTDLIVDLRYNGGGLISIAQLLTDLLGRDRSTGDVQGYVSYRPEKAAANDETRLFRTQPESVAPTRIAFIGTSGTASASELVINNMTPYLHGRSALIGGNTYGKPVGQVALDQPDCNDRLRVIAFAVQNSARSAAYFDGLAGAVEASCQAGDDLALPLGDQREDSVARALDFLAGRTCTPIGTASTGVASRALGERTLLTPARPTVAQREVPGLY